MKTIKTLKEFNDYYGFWEGMSEEDRRKRVRQIMRTAEYYNDLDEDTPDYEGYEDANREYRDQAVHHLNSQ